jgi:hypothetical protein
MNPRICQSIVESHSWQSVPLDSVQFFISEYRPDAMNGDHLVTVHGEILAGVCLVGWRREPARKRLGTTSGGQQSFEPPSSEKFRRNGYPKSLWRTQIPPSRKATSWAALTGGGVNLLIAWPSLPASHPQTARQGGSADQERTRRESTGYPDRPGRSGGRDCHHPLFRNPCLSQPQGGDNSFDQSGGALRLPYGESARSRAASGGSGIYRIPQELYCRLGRTCRSAVELGCCSPHRAHRQSKRYAKLRCIVFGMTAVDAYRTVVTVRFVHHKRTKIVQGRVCRRPFPRARCLPCSASRA